MREQEPRQVPQLLWAEAYEATFRPHFEDMEVLDKTTRAACSVMLLGLLVDGPRERLGTYLGLPPAVTNGDVANAIQLARARHGSNRQENDLARLIEEAGSMREAVDHAERRERLRDFDELPPEAWARIVRSSGLHRGKPGGRSVYSAMWLWAHMTGGDPGWSPAAIRLLVERSKKSVTTCYGQFLSTAPTEIWHHLRQYGTELLAAQNQDGGSGYAR